MKRSRDRKEKREDKQQQYPEENYKMSKHLDYHTYTAPSATPAMKHAFAVDSLDKLYEDLCEERIDNEIYLFSMGFKWEYAHLKSQEPHTTKEWEQRSFEILREVKNKLYLPNRTSTNTFYTILRDVPEILLLFVLDGEIREWVRLGLKEHLECVIEYYSSVSEGNRALSVINSRHLNKLDRHEGYKSIASEIEACIEMDSYPAFTNLLHTLKERSSQ